MKVVKLLRCDYAAQERLSLQMLSWAQTHADDICFPAHQPRVSTARCKRISNAPKFVHDLL